MSFTRFTPPTTRKILTEQLSERLRRTKKACEKVHQAYVFNKTTDRNEIELSLYRQRYPKNWVRKLTNLCRVKLEKPGLFIIDEENTVEEGFKTREVLVYTLFETVYHPANPHTQQLAYCITKMGVFKSPNVLLERDDLGNVTKSDVVSWSNMFYIPWDGGRSAHKVIDEFGGEYRETVLATAKEADDSWNTGSVYSVPNLEEWITADWDDLRAANIGGFLKPEYGGTVQYLRDKDQKRQWLQAEVKEFEGKNKKSDKTKS